MAGNTVGTPTLNKKWRLDLDTASTGTPVWVQVMGIRKFTPTKNTTTADASTYDTDAWGADAITGKKWGVTGAVLRSQYGDTTKAYDAGQEALRAAADSDTLVHVRFYERGVTSGEAYEGYALVKWEPQGGDPNALNEVNFELLGQGARTMISAPTP